jgi:hypothetical protein
MKSYHLLLRNPMAEHAFGISGGPDEVNPVDWLKGHALTSVPDPITLQLHPASGDSPDLADIAGGLYTVFSNRLRSALQAAGVDNVDYYPARLVHPTSRHQRDDYFAVNVLGLVSAVDVSKSTISPGRGRIPGVLRQFTIDPQRGGDLRLFRLAESPRLIIIDNGVKAELEKAALDGVFIQPTQSWTGTNSGPP